MRAIAPALLGLALFLAGPGRADEVTDPLDQAKRLYEEGDIAGALAELEFATQALRAKIAEALVASFPEPPPGWRVERTEESGGGLAFLGGSAVKRTYRRDAGGSVEAQILTGGGLLQGFAQMMANPQVLAAQPGAKRVRIGRESAVVTFDGAQRSGQLVVDLGGKGTLLLQGSDLSGPEPMVELAQRFDLARIKQLIGS